MKYQSELIKEIVDKRGHKFPSLHYQSECVESWIEETKGSYPKLCDYEGEWLNYILAQITIGEFPYVTLSDVTEATVNNVIPYEYKSAILKGSTKYRDIDTGEFLETFEEGRNLELVSVRMPVLSTTGKNLFGGFDNYDTFENGIYYKENANRNNKLTSNIYLNKGDYVISLKFKKSTNYEQSLNFTVGDEEFMFSKGTSFYEGEKSVAFTVINGGYFSFFIATGASYGLYLSNIQIEQGSNATSYEPFKSNILMVNEDVTLRGVGDVQDELNCLTGEVTERIGEIVLDGSEDEKLSLRLSYGLIYEDVLYNNNYISNHQLKKIYQSKVDRFCIIIPSTITTISEARQWLSENNVIIQLPLAEESIKTVDLTISDQDGNTLTIIKPIEGTMHLSTDSETIKPTFTGEIPVEAITQNLASFIKE